MSQPEKVNQKREGKASRNYTSGRISTFLPAAISYAYSFMNAVIA